ncbi:MAG: flagellar motor switch protein FliM [Halanaerobiaceae bacterium]
MADVLDQNEIDSLLSSLSSGDVDMEEIKGETSEEVKTYDFRRPNKLSKEQMRTLEMIHENLARILTTTLSTKLRSMVDFEVASIEQLSYEEFIRSLPEPTIIGISQLKPLEGQFILEVNPDIGFAIIDRLFGGLGQELEETRTFTDIERVVLEKVISWFLSGIPDAWENILELNPRLVEIESNPQFTQVVPSNDMTIIITLSARIANSEGLINVCVPYIMLEPIVSRLNAQQWFASTRKEQTAQHIEKLKKRVSKAQLNLFAELGRTELTVKDMLFLEEGDVIRLDKNADEKINIRVENKLKFKGIAGTSQKHRAMKILEVLGEEDEDEDEVEGVGDDNE